MIDKENKIKEDKLRQIIKESIKKYLNEGTSFQDSIDKWYQVQKAIGSQQMLDCIFKWSSSDQIEQWLQWFEDEEWISFDNNEGEEY